MRPIRIVRWLVVASVVLRFATGCLQAASATCGNGSVCPPGFLCVDTQHTTPGSQICAAGTCGNGVLDPGEACDDGNNKAGDGCPADCAQPCGDGVLDPGEVCDDGNNLDGDGCAADCKSRDGVFLVSPSAVAFVIAEGDAAPAPVTVAVHFGRHGDSLQLGYAAGVSQPSWLSITAQPIVDNTAALELAVTDVTGSGQRATSVQLTISHDDASADTVELPVSYAIQRSDLTIATAPTALTFTGTASEIVAPQLVDVTFTGDDLAVVSAPAWLAVSGALPTMTSPATLQVAVDPAHVVVGASLSDDIVLATTRGAVRRTTKIHVEANLGALPPLTIVAAPAQLAFSAYAAGPAPAARAVTVTFSGDHVAVASAPAWLTVTAASDPTASPATFTVAANTTAFPAGDAQAAEVVFVTANVLAQLSVSVHVDYQLAAPPELQFVTPYVGTAGRPGALSVHGIGFLPGVPVVVGVAGLQLPATPVSAVELAIAYPALAAGRYPVTMLTPAAPAPPLAPELVIVPPPAFTYQAIVVSGQRFRIIYDAERQTIYANHSDAFEVERFAYAAGAWSTLPAVPISFFPLRDIALTPNGRELLVADKLTLSSMALADGTLALTPIAAIPSDAAGCNLFGGMSMAGNGKVFINSELEGSGFCSAYFYDVRDQSITATGKAFFGGSSAVSGDGNHIYARSSTDSQVEPFFLYDATTDTQTSRTIDLEQFNDLAVSGDASHVIINDTAVYDRTLHLTGNIPLAGLNGLVSTTTVASHDNSRAFVYAADFPGGGPRVEVYDLNGALLPGAIYPRIAVIALPDAANQLEDTFAQMIVSPDDGAVFISGDRHLLVVPVGPALASSSARPL